LEKKASRKKSQTTETVVAPPEQQTTEKPQEKELVESVKNLELKEEPEDQIHVQKEPIVQEIIQPVERVEVQPVIHREREQIEVHQVTQHIKQTQVLPNIIEEKELPARDLGEFVETTDAVEKQLKEFGSQIEPTVHVDHVHFTREIKEPIIQETVTKTVHEVVQPVIHRETIAPTVIHATLPLHEKIVEVPVIIKEEVGEVPPNPQEKSAI